MHNKIKPNYQLINIIVDFGKASRILHKAKQLGIPGGTVCLAAGTVNHGFLNFLGLRDTRKEIIYMVADKRFSSEVLEILNKEFEFYKPNHGIAYTTDIGQVIGTRLIRFDKCEDEGDENMHQLINVIVDRGKAEVVIEAATEVGSKGGTIINARGSGVHETQKLFGMEVEPEKEIVVIIAKIEDAEAIVENITLKIDISKPGNGIIYTQNVNKVYGLAE
ncbi:MAG: P-II family nitrogen regulator [Gudongella sp.]|nr:P-II family nitrogen regulator [Gudongella sp.]